MDSEDGQLFIKNLAHFVRTHEKALANALQLRRQQNAKNGSQEVTGMSGSQVTSSRSSLSSSSTSSTLAAALSLPYLSFASHHVKPAKLSLTPHHLFYLLSRFEDLGIPVGPMNVRLENLHADTSANYVSFLSQSQRSNARGSDRASIHSVSSVRSVMSGMSSLWANWSLGNSTEAKSEKQRAQIQADLTYLYSAFTKIPCLRLAPDRRARLIAGYEEFPFDTAVPLVAFKNVSALEIADIDIRQFYGWDRMADQLRSLTVKRAGVDDPADLLINIVLDDTDKRRRRSSKAQISPTTTWAMPSSPKRSPTLPHATLVNSSSAPASPDSSSSRLEEALEVPASTLSRSTREYRGHRRAQSKGDRPRSNSPVRPPSARAGSSHGHVRSTTYKVKRSGSGSSNSSMSDSWYTSHRSSSSNLLAMSVLPPSKWRFLKHLSLAENALTSIAAECLIPLANTLHSLDLSSNLFVQIPDSLASLTALRALNLSHCMIDSLHSLTRNPLPAITALNLRGNRLQSLAGVERLYPLERLDLRDNKLTDPTELARLTGMPDIREIWISGNPFTRTHSNYRVTIFNLFRSSPGYGEDILIDSVGPSYNERRQLIDRVAERPNVPVVKPAVPDAGPAPISVIKPTITYGDTPKAPAVLRKERPSDPMSTSEVYRSSRRKKPSRKKVLEPTPGETPLAAPLRSTVRFVADEHDLTTAVPESSAESDSGYGVSPKSPAPLHHADAKTISTRMAPPPLPPLTRTEGPRLNASAMPPLSPIQSREYEPAHAVITDPTPPPPSLPPPDWNVSGELYRQKIEALRSEVGTGWLSALHEESWDINKSTPMTHKDFNPAGVVLVPAHAASQQSIHSGRTLG